MSRFYVIFICLVGMLFYSCTSMVSVKDMSEERGYTSIKTRYANKSWEEVAKDVNEFRVRYPYSKYTPELELIQANSYFNSRNYLTAAVTYEDFIKRNPTDPNLEFATYKIAECYDRDSSKEEDRDQSHTQTAMIKYQEFLVKFPRSTNFKDKAETRINILKRRLAENSLFIATFYWNKRLYAAALMRYLEILNHYSEFENMAQIAKTNGTFCYKKLAEELEKHPKSEENLFFRNETPQGLREKAKVLAATEKTM